MIEKDMRAESVSSDAERDMPESSRRELLGKLRNAAIIVPVATVLSLSAREAYASPAWPLRVVATNPAISTMVDAANAVIVGQNPLQLLFEFDTKQLNHLRTHQATIDGMHLPAIVDLTNYL